MTTRHALHRHPNAFHASLLALLLWGQPAPADNGFRLDQEHVRPHGGMQDEPIAKPDTTAPLPPWPRDADLINFVPDGPTLPFKFSVDGRNLSLHDRNSEVRYTLVIESPTGTRNVSFEAIRCTLHGAYKVFAYGTDGRFVKAPGEEWLAIPEVGNESYREDLRQRFCVPREFRARPIKDLQRALRGHVARTDGTGFQAQ